MIIKPERTSSPEGSEKLAVLLDRFQTSDDKCSKTVAEILADVRSKGDDAIVE